MATPLAILLDPAREPAELIAALEHAMATGRAADCVLILDRHAPVSEANPYFAARFAVDRLPDGLYQLLPLGPLTRGWRP